MNDQRPENCPARIPDHELLRCVGKGSYGEIWLARNVMGRYRAVKVIFRNQFGNAAPFEREFRGIQQFEPISRSHPAVIAILHAGEKPEEGYFYYVMELADHVAGGAEINVDSYVPKTLSEILEREKPLSVEECIELGLRLTGALTHLHENGLVHRDIKPSNIIFVQGQAKLADIGLVSGIAAAKSYVGTEGYIPPEGAGSFQADIFSLGKVLYEAVTGKDRQNFPNVPTQLGTAPASESQKYFELNEVLVKACHPSSALRYRSAKEMEADLALLRQGKSVKRANAVRRNIARARVGAGIGVLAAVIFVGAVVWKRRLVAEIRSESAHSNRPVIAAPEILKEPVDLELNPGTPGWFSVEARRVGTIRYQWLHNGKALLSETNASLVLSSVGLADEGEYAVRVSNEGGNSESAIARLTVNTSRILPSSHDLWDIQSGAQITRGSGFLSAGSPSGMFGEHGQTLVDDATYSYFADNAPERFAHYVEWMTTAPVEVRAVRLFAVGDGSEVNHAREFNRFTLKTKSPGSSSFDITLLTFTPTHPYEMLDSSTYAILDVELPAVKGQMFRAEFVQEDRHPPYNGPRIMELDAFSDVPQIFPSFLKEPVSQRAALGESVVFATLARGGKLQYQWKHNDQVLPGANESKLTLKDLSPQDSGTYSLTVSNEIGAIYSAPATLEVGPKASPGRSN